MNQRTAKLIRRHAQAVLTPKQGQSQGQLYRAAKREWNGWTAKKRGKARKRLQYVVDQYTAELRRLQEAMAQAGG